MGFATNTEDRTRLPGVTGGEQRRRARVCSIASTVTIAAFSVFILYDAIFEPSWNIVLLVVLLAVALYSHILNKRGFTNVAVIMLVGPIIMGLFALAAVNDGLYDTALQALPAVMIVAALLLQKRQMILLSALSLCALCVLGVLQINNVILHHARTAMSTTDIFDLLVIYVTTILVVMLISSYLRESAVEARDREIRLVESEERFHLAMEATNDGLWDWNIVTDGGYFSPGYYRMLGYGVDSFPANGEAWEHLIHPEDRERALRVNTDCIEGRCEHFELEYRLRHKNGDWRWILGRGKCVARDEQGRALRLTGTHIDITDRKQVEAALRESEEKFANVFHSAPVWIAITDMDNAKYLEVNEEALLVTGFAREDVIGHTAIEIGWITAGDRERLVDEIRAHGRIAGLEMTFRAKDGRSLYGLVNGEQMEVGGRNCLLTVTVDITERKLAEWQIQMLKHSIDVHFDGAYWMDTKNQFIYVNDAGCKALGYTREELIGKSVSDVNPVATDDAMKRVWEKLRVEGSFTSESVHRRKDETRFPVEITTSLVLFGGNEYNCGFARDITQRRRSEQALLESEERYRNLFNNNHAVMLIIDPDSGAIVDANPAACAYYGWSRDDLLNMRIHDINTLSVEEITAEIRMAVTQQHRHLFFKHRHADGAIRDVEIYTGPVSLGSKALLYSIVHDVTEHKQAEKALLESEIQFRTFIEQAPTAIAVSRNGIGLYANQKLADTIGLHSVDDFVGANINEFFTPAYREESIERTRRRSLGLSVPSEFETVVLHADGSTSFVQLAVATVPLRDGTANIAFVTDITERKRVERAIQESEEKFKSTFMTSLDAIYIATLEEGRIIEVNDAFEDVFGFTREETVGKTSLELNLYHDPDDRTRAVNSLKTTGHVRDLEVKGRKKDGEIIVASLSITTLPIGCELHIVGVVRDITDRKRSEEELMRRMKELTSWQRVTVGRENRVLELKNEVNELLTKLGQAPRYRCSGA